MEFVQIIVRTDYRNIVFSLFLSEMHGNYPVKVFCFCRVIFCFYRELFYKHREPFYEFGGLFYR